MANDDYVNPFQAVHQKVQAAKDRARENRESDLERQKKSAEEEAIREGSSQDPH
jgi:hypothetical protein